MIQALVSSVISSEALFPELDAVVLAQLNIESMGLNPAQFVPGLLSAIAILALGVILAFIAAALARGILKRTGLEQQMSTLMSDPLNPRAPLQVGKWFSGIVFAIVLIFAVVAALEALQLTAVSAPLQDFLRRISAYLPPLAGALLLLGIAWVLATTIKLITTRALQALRLEERLQQLSGTMETVKPAIGETLGNILFALVFVVFLPPILQALGLTIAAEPILALLDQAFTVLLNVIGATIVATIGWLIARFVSRVVTSLLMATGVDRLGHRVGLNPNTGTQSLSQVAGTVVYVAILMPTAIAALQVLQIEAISVPAIAMLNQILGALPKILTAAVILFISFLVGRFVGQLVTSLLSGLGFNNIFNLLGLPVRSSSATTTSASWRSPAEIVGIIVVVGIMLFGVVAATDVLALPALTSIVQSLMQVFGQVISSLVIFGVGLYLANLAFSIITSSGSGQARILGHAARIAIIAFVSAMALRQMGVATDIVNLAFGLLLGAIAVAIALAFGLGGRDIAAEQVRNWLNSFRQMPAATGVVASATPVASGVTATTPSADPTLPDAWPPTDESVWVEDK